MIDLKERRNMKDLPTKLKVFSWGLISGVVFVLGILVYVVSIQPKPTEREVWAKNHEQEMKWTIERYNKFQQVAQEAFLENDVVTMK